VYIHNIHNNNTEATTAAAAVRQKKAFERNKHLDEIRTHS